MDFYDGISDLYGMVLYGLHIVSHDMIPTYSNDGGMMVCGVFICWFDFLRILVNVGYTYMYCHIL